MNTELDVCECCLFWVGNADDSTCRGYYGHDHGNPSFDGYAVVLDPEGVERWSEWTCGGCQVPQLPGARAYVVEVN